MSLTCLLVFTKLFASLVSRVVGNLFATGKRRERQFVNAKAMQEQSSARMVPFVCYVFYKCGEVTHGEFPASSPVARDQWGIFLS